MSINDYVSKLVADDKTRLFDCEKSLTKLFPNKQIERILLIMPPEVDSSVFSFDVARRGRYTNYPPYGLGLLASALRQISIEVRLLNLNNIVLRASRTTERKQDFDFDSAWMNALTEELDHYEPDLVGASCMFSITHQSLTQVCSRVHMLRPELPIAVGGVHITNALADKLTTMALIRDLPAVKFFFRYECDRAFPHFIQIIQGKAPLESLAQVLFKDGDDLSYFDNRMVVEGDVLDRIPAHDLMDSIELSRWGKVGTFYFYLPNVECVSTILSNRGCRGQCVFCSVRNFNGAGVRRRSVQSVIDELLILKNEYAVQHIMWLDDDFLYDRVESLKLFNEMVRQNVGVTWDCTNGVIAASCTDEVIAAAAASGCIGLSLGIESGSPEILKEMHKPGTTGAFLKVASVLHKYDSIQSYVFLIIGFPGETYGQLMDTIKVSQEMDLDWHKITVLQLLPNTAAFERMLCDGQVNEKKFNEFNFSIGPYGKTNKDRVGRDMLSLDFKDAFTGVEANATPTVEDLALVLPYMMYYLNYYRLFFEQRKIKIVRQLRNLGHILDTIAPNDVFAMYFAALLQHRLNGFIESQLELRLRSTIAEYPYWSEQLENFGLSPKHLTSGHFPIPEKRYLFRDDRA